MIGMVDIPIVYKANEWFRTQHPAPELTAEGPIDPSMEFVLYFTGFSLMILFWCLVRARRRLESLSRENSRNAPANRLMG